MLNKLKNRLMNPLFFFLNESYSVLSDKAPYLVEQSPLVLKIRITSKCNLSCPFCYLKDGLNQDEKDHLSLEEWEKILSKLPKYTIIDITGAEPVAYSNFIPFIRLLKKLGLKYSITTNGTLYNKDTAEELVKNGLQVLMVSLDGMEETHNRLRGNRNAFKRTIEFIKRVEEAKRKYNSKTPLISIKSTVLDENYSELQTLMDLCSASFAVDVLTFTFLFQNRARGGMELLDNFHSEEFKTGNYAKYKNKDEVKDFVREIESSKKRYRFPIVYKPRMKFQDVLRYIDNPSQMNVDNCPQYLNNLTLYFDGKLSPCDIGLNLGNIRDHDYSFKGVYNSESYRVFKKNMTSKHKACQGCCAGCHK